MGFPGPWITPHTTRFGGVDTSGLPDVFISRYLANDWDEARDGSAGATGPTQIEAPYDTTAHILDYLVFPTFIQYQVAQAYSWHDLAAIDPLLAFPPYTDVPPGAPIDGVEYEDPHGTILATPRVQVVASTGGGNLSLPDALIDFYQLPPTLTGLGSPGFHWFPSIGLAVNGAYEVGSIDSAGPVAVFDGIPVASTDTIVILQASDAQTQTPFPYPTPTDTGFQQFAQVGVLVEYFGPRFRFVYTTPPPQRQFPRDDGLAISTRRSWPVVTSKQFGQRRGPVATYQ